MANSLRVLNCYRYNGLWVFDDPAVGLEREPFVPSATQILDSVCLMQGIRGDRINVIFSDRSFPGHQAHAHWVEAAEGGNWYEVNVDGLSHHGWLCPALLNYFEEPPQELFFEIIECAAQTVQPLP